MLVIIISLAFIAFGVHKFLNENNTYSTFLGKIPTLLSKPLGKCLYCFSFWFISLPTFIAISYVKDPIYIILSFIPPYLASLIHSILELIAIKNELNKQKIHTETLIQQGTQINNEILKNKLIYE